MADSNWSNVTLALHLDGANGSTTFTDEKGHTATPTGTVAISTATAAPLTGNTASAYFDGGASTPALTFPADAGYNDFGTGDFTIELWVRPVDSDYTYGCLSVQDGTFGWRLNVNGGGLYFVAGASYSLAISDTSYVYIQANSWHHVTVCRASGVTKLFCDGVTHATHTGSISISSPSSTLGVGKGWGVANAFKGYMDDIRITKGFARYTADFTPPTAPFEAGVTLPSGTASLPLRVESCPVGSASTKISASILPLAILNGSQTVSVGTGANAANWIPVVRIAGIDKSAQVIGEIRIEAEEGAARVAEITLRPPTGTALNLVTWTGLAVEIDVADNSTGTPRYPMRLFTGVIDTPTLDQTTRTIGLRCTDDLQGRCLALDSADLSALIGGYYSPAVFDAAANGWTMAQDRLSTIPASLDISPSGQMRVTTWTSKTTPDLTLTDTLIGEASIQPSIADRSGLINEVIVDFGYRFPRVKVEGHLTGYTAVDLIGFSQYIIDGKYFLQRAQCEAAITKAGGTIMQIVYTPLPTNIIAVGSGYWSPGPSDGELCMGFTAQVSFDYTQTIEEQHQISVRNPLSIAAVGLRSSTLSGALEGAYPDLVATETNIKLYKEGSSTIPPANVATMTIERTASADVTLSPETDRTAANAAMETLIAIAKTRIMASHRRNSVSARVPLMPVVDLDKTIQINADGVLAKGKCSRVTHRLQPEAGEAISEFSIAISALAGVGVSHVTDPTVAPAGTTATTTPLTNAPIIVFNNGAAQDHVLSITFPAVWTSERDNAAIILPSVINAPINEDLFTVTL